MRFRSPGWYSRCSGSVMFLPVINVNGGTPVDWWGVARAGHQYQRKFDIPILLIGGHILLQHADHCFIGPFNLTRGNWVMAYMELACTPRSFHTSCMMSAVKWVPRSELALKASKSWKDVVLNRQAVVLLYHGSWGALLSTSWIRRPRWGKYLFTRVDRAGAYPVYLGGPQGKVIPFLCSGARWFGFAGLNWQHTRHPFTYSATSCCMPGQYATCLSVS